MEPDSEPPAPSSTGVRGVVVALACAATAVSVHLIACNVASFVVICVCNFKFHEFVSDGFYDAWMHLGGLGSCSISLRVSSPAQTLPAIRSGH